jgi:hypothetical protein
MPRSIYFMIIKRYLIKNCFLISLLSSCLSSAVFHNWGSAAEQGCNGSAQGVDLHMVCGGLSCLTNTVVETLDMKSCVYSLVTVMFITINASS